MFAKPLWTSHTLHRLAATAILGAALVGSAAAASPGTDADRERWADLQESFFPGRTVEDAGGVIALEAPYRAHDAALVPITMTTDPSQAAGRQVKAIHLLVDGNPVPLAGVFHLAPNQKPQNLSTRVRVNEYTFIHAVAEMDDGRLLAAERYVKAAGGCSAPAMKDPQEALARLGKMKLNLPEVVFAGQPVTAQLLISHPNHTGMQFDQVARLYVPPHFIQSIKVSFDGQPVLTAETDISLSEDPSLHFTFVPAAAGSLDVEVTDSEGAVYTGQWSIAPVPAS